MIVLTQMDSKELSLYYLVDVLLKNITLSPYVYNQLINYLNIISNNKNHKINKDYKLIKPYLNRSNFYAVYNCEHRDNTISRQCRVDNIRKNNKTHTKILIMLQFGAITAHIHIPKTELYSNFDKFLENYLYDIKYHYIEYTIDELINIVYTLLRKQKLNQL